MDVKRPAIVISIVFLLVAVFVLAGCTKEPAPQPFVTVSQPALPGECFAPAPAVPRLPEADVDTATAARDRQKLVEGIKVRDSNSKACAERLRALFPEEKRS